MAKTHGYARRGKLRSRTYRIWIGIHTRCNNQKKKEWSRYGGRGIKVCERWHRFENFLADMSDCPDGLTIERINSNGNYEPGNCRWATHHDQTRNKRTNVNLTFNEETLCVADWAKELGMTRETISGRLSRGWSIEKTLTHAVRDWGRPKTRSAV